MKQNIDFSKTFLYGVSGAWVKHQRCKTINENTVCFQLQKNQHILLSTLDYNWANSIPTKLCCLFFQKIEKNQYSPSETMKRENSLRPRRLIQHQARTCPCSSGEAMLVFGAGCSQASGKVTHGCAWRKQGTPEATPRHCVSPLCGAQEGLSVCQGHGLQCG